MGMQVWEKKADWLAAAQHERYDQYEQRQSFGWLAFISCPADMRTWTRNKGRRCAGRCNVATWCSSSSSNRQGDGCDGIGTPRGRLLSGLKNGLVFRLSLSFSLSLSLSLPLPLSSPLPSLFPSSFRFAPLLHFSCIQRQPTIREIEKALVRERVKSVVHRSTHQCLLDSFLQQLNIVERNSTRGDGYEYVCAYAYLCVIWLSVIDTGTDKCTFWFIYRKVLISD